MDQEIHCPFCGAEHEAAGAGQKTCTNCGGVFIAEEVLCYRTYPVPCAGPHEYDNTRVSCLHTTDEQAASYNESRFLGRTDWAACRLWVRTCVNCLHQDTVVLPPDSSSPWEDA